MININLLPNQYKNKLKFRRIQSYFNSLLLLVIILLVCISALMFFLKFLISSSGTDVDNQIQKTKDEIAQYKEVQNQVADFNNRISIISNIYDKTPSWTQILSNLAKSTPGDLTVTEYSIDTATTREISIKGKSKSISSVMTFKKNLEDAEFFSKVTISELTGTKMEKSNITIFNFSITANCDFLKYSQLKSDTAKSTSTEGGTEK